MTELLKFLQQNVTDATDKEFNNTVTPPTTPEFKPEIHHKQRKIRCNWRQING